MTPVVELLRHIYLGFAHVLAFLFLPTHKSFQTIHELTEAGYRVSYLDHCRLQHNVRFGTLAYSLVLVVAITLVRTSVEIIYPEQFGQAAFAVTYTVNTNASDDDTQCDPIGVGDCTIREALDHAGSNDTISFDAVYNIVLTQELPLVGQSGLTIDGGGSMINCNSVANNGLRLTNTNITIKNLEINNCSQNGVSVESTGASLQNLTIGQSGTNGVVFKASNGTLQDSTVVGTGSTTNCISANDATNQITIQNNVLQQCDNGIATGDGQTFTISNNTIHLTTDSLISTGGSSTMTISNNKFGVDENGAASTFTGPMDFEGGSNVTVSSNTFVDAASNNVSASGTSSLTLSSNTFTGTGITDGVVLENTQGARVFGNTFSDVAGADLYALKLTGNPNDTVIGIDVDGSDAANTFSDNTKALYLNGSVNLVKSNTFSNNEYDLDAVDLTESFIQNNTFTDGDSGVHVQNSPGTWVTQNTFTGDYAVGALVADTNSTGLEISNNTFTNVLASNVIYLKGGSSNCQMYNNTLARTVDLDTTQTGIRLENSSACTLTKNTFSLPDGYGLVLSSATTDTIVGYDLLDAGTPNIFSSNLIDVVLDGSGVTGSIIRRNSSDLTTDQLIVAQNGAIDATPADTTYTEHTTGIISGNTQADALVDVYSYTASPAAVTWLTSVVADVNGDWLYEADLSSYDSIYSTVSTTDGTGLFTASDQPSSDVIVSAVTVSDITTTTAKLNWTTNISTTSEIHNKPENNVEQMITVADPGTNHTYTLTDLTADTSYRVQVVGFDVDLELNRGISDNVNFTTAAAAVDNTLATYSENVASTVRVNSVGGSTVVGGDGSTDTQFTMGDLTFVFNDQKARLTDYRLHFVLKVAKANVQDIINKKKAFNNLGKAKFTVKQQQLSLDKTYAVLSGVIKQDGSYLNTTGLTKRFTFTLQDVPQLIYPSNTEIFYRMPEEFIVASKAPSVTVFIDDVNGAEVVHCTTVMENGLGSCNMPFHVPGLGEYTIRLVDSRGGSVFESILFSDIAPNETITTDVRSANFFKRIIFGGNPTFAGLVGTGNTIELHIPQINGPMYAQVTGNNWMFTLTLTTLSYGATEFTVIERNPAGNIVNQNDYLVYRSYRPVVPAVIAPEDNSAATTAPIIQVIAPNDHTLEIFNSKNVRLFLGDFVNGGRTVDLSNWFSNPGTYTITLQNRNSLNIPSAFTTFTFTITAPTTVSETDNTNTSNNTNTPPEADQPMADTTNTNQINTNTSTTDQTQPDTDSDGLSDSIEELVDTDLTNPDTDGDGVLDGAEVSNQTSPTDPDSDDDDLSDNEPVDYGTDALDADSDNDGLLDGEEISRSCDPLNVDSDGDKIDDLVEALTGTDCSSIDNLWSNLSNIEAYLQEQASTVGVNYPLITHQIVSAEADLDQKLTQQITAATTLDVIPGAKTVVSDGTIRVITQTTEISVVDWLTGQNPTTTDNTYVLVSGTVSLPDSVREQPAYVLVTFFSTPMVKIAQVDGNGQWTMTVPAELLTTGEHTALAALEVNGTRSEQVEVAKFVINHKRKLSSTSWLVIVNVVVAILALLIAVIVHLRRKQSDESYA